MTLTPSMLLALVGALGIFLFFWSLGRRRTSSESDVLETRLKSYGDEGVTLDDIDLQAPFSERVLIPAFERVTGFFERQTGARQRAALNHDLVTAGVRSLDAGGFMVVRYGGAIVLFAIGLVLGIFFAQPLFIALLSGVGAGLGFFMPVMWLRQKVGDRRKQIQKGLPDAMDLLTIAVEAGLGFDSAMSRVTEKFKNALSDEFAQVLQETRLGRPRLEALDEMGRRAGVDDLHNFVQAVIQSEQMGVGVAKILRIQSEEMRRKRRQRAQEKAAQATLKMMLPMVGCIFPTLWIVLLGPAILMMVNRH
jgi:tight adherence protein C